MPDDLVKRLRKISIVERGKVRLSHAGDADYYINIKKAYGKPEIFRLITSYLWQKIEKQLTCITGSGHGGIPLASDISTNHDMPLTLIRKKEKDHGIKTYIDGHIPQKNDKVVIVDDVLTSGGSLQDVIDLIKPTGAEILGCCVVVKRGEDKLDVPVTYLMTEKALL